MISRHRMRVAVTAKKGYGGGVIREAFLNNNILEPLLGRPTEISVRIALCMHSSDMAQQIEMKPLRPSHKVSSFNLLPSRTLALPRELQREYKGPFREFSDPALIVASSCSAKRRRTYLHDTSGLSQRLFRLPADIPTHFPRRLRHQYLVVNNVQKYQSILLSNGQSCDFGAARQ